MLEGNKYNLILASASPRRKELLSWIDIPFSIMSSDVEEVATQKDPKSVVEELAELKGRDIWDKIQNENKIGHPLIVSADTLVCLNNKIYGKPKDREDAVKMLKELSGKTHTVMTGVFMKCFDLDGNREKEFTFSCSSHVSFDEIDDDLLNHYLKSNEYKDKAGSYGIQGKGLTFVSKIEGSYSNVVGFPLNEFIKELKFFVNQDKNDSNGNWREFFVR